ncbi:MAG TPA: GIY-YIG nuclease family protein, partial [Prolixibacteraceae bacterium]|nr:GIY-YIG nuclease family protein [Prolixibacteraceae bacterium]
SACHAEGRGFESRPHRQMEKVASREVTFFGICNIQDKMFYAYIIQSQKDLSFYIGHTSDMQKRLDYHNSGLSCYTSKKKPWKLVYFETYETKQEANAREYFLKRQKNKSFYERLIKGTTNELIKGDQ